jgi:acetolactate synthase-1/2/3 large subunit
MLTPATTSNVSGDQFGGRTVGAELHNPDLVKLAEAYGVRAEGPDALDLALREAFAADAPSLIEVPVGMMPTPFT